ncbi:MAG: methyltransferase domain-containing protein [Thermomicrobiales bacterium]
MLPKPTQFGRDYGSQFSDASVVSAYHLRPPYPEGTFEILETLLPTDCRSVLDLGCGTGEIARGMAPRVDRVDAVDPSAGMIAKGQSLPGGSVANIAWIHGSAERGAFQGPYDLVVAGASLHWMEWDVVLPRITDSLAVDGSLAIVELEQDASPWSDGISGICGKYSTNQEFRPYKVVDELVQRELFVTVGSVATETIVFTLSVSDYVESFHARNGFSRDRMTAAAGETFDRDITSLVEPYATDGMVELQIRGSVVWGQPE